MTRETNRADTVPRSTGVWARNAAILLLPEGLLVVAIAAEAAVEAWIVAGGTELAVPQALLVVPPVLLAPAVAGLTDRLTRSRLGLASALLLGAVVTVLVSVWIASTVTEINCRWVGGFQQIAGRALLVAVTAGGGTVATSRASAWAASQFSRRRAAVAAAVIAAVVMMVAVAFLTIGAYYAAFPPQSLPCPPTGP